METFNWTKDDSELIDFDNCSFEEESLEIKDSCKIYRIGDEIKIENINNNEVNSSKNLNLNEYDENMKLGEIKYKDKKYYFFPNRKEDMNELTGEELFSWLIYKGNKFPMTKNKYKLKEGDIIRLGRVWLIVRVLHIPAKKLDRKNTNCLISYHSQINESLNINNDFREDRDYYKNLIGDEDSDITEDEEENEEEENDKNITDNNMKDSNNKDENHENKRKKKNKGKNYNPKIINVKKKEDKIKYDSNKLEKQKLCRICYMTETSSLINPLIKPCKCSGSMKYIHLKCLMQWLKTKIQIDKSEYLENDYFALYSSEKVQCELCKQIFPNYIEHNKKIYNLLELELKSEKNKNNNKKVNNINYTDGDNYKKNKDKKDYENENTNDGNYYVVFDTIPIDKSIPSYLYLSKFNKDKKLRIGRGLDMNLIMNDLSISRNHCELEINDNGDVLLKDNNSKFGTLILVQAKSMEILKGQTLTLQIGRTFLHINCKKANSSLFNCCEAEVIDKNRSYEDMNYRSIKITNNALILYESDSDGNEEEDENKNSENDYENIIKNVNNAKVNLLTISNKKKNSVQIDIDNNEKKEDKLDESKNEEKDKIKETEEKERKVSLYVDGEDIKKINKVENENENKEEKNEEKK